MEILSTEIGLTYSHKALRAQIEASGWTVTKVKLDSKSGRYVAEAKDERGTKLERKGKTEQLALSNLLIAVNHRTSSTHLGRWDHTFNSQLEEIAQAYSKAPLYEPKASASFMELAKDCERRVEVLRQHLDIQVVLDPEPYKKPEQLFKDVRKSRRLKVSRAGADHPVWTEKQVIDYRICHDVFGYVASGAGWDWAGENEAFAFHAEILPEEAQKALFTESIASTAYAAYYRAYGQQKVALFPKFMDQAQKKNNPYKGHPGVHPTQTLPPGPEPSVKHIVEGSFIPGIDELTEPENIRLAATGTGTIDPTLADPNVGYESPYMDNPMTTANGMTIQQAAGNPLESAKVSENANLINTSNAPSAGAKSGIPNSGTEWAYLNKEDPTQLATMKRAIVNAFRVVLLSPRKDLRWNAIHYQDISHIPGDEDNPKVYWDTLEQKRQEWNESRGYDRYAHLPYMKQMPALVNTLYQKNPSRGFPYAQKRAAEMVQNWITEEQNRQLALDADKPESKRRQSFQVDTKANYELTKRLQTYLAEHKPNLDHQMTKKVKQRFKDKGLDSKQFLPTLSAALDESPEDIHEPAPAADVSKYGAFMGEHLKAIAKVSRYVDQILEAALDDVHQHNGQGFHFRSCVLQLNIPGVGPKVCSFAWLLLQPMTSELATIDTHMMDLLGHQEKEMNNRDYFGMERELRAGRDAAGYQHMPMGQFQWGMWDYKRTGAGSHQDHSAMSVLDPKPHTSIDWAAKEQPVGAAGAVEWKNMWQTDPPEWWKQTLPARQDAWNEFQATTAAGTSKSKVPYVGIPDGYTQNPNSNQLQPLSRTASWPQNQTPWIVHPRSGEMLHGQPGQSIMSHALGALSVTDPREVWSQLPDELVGRTTYSSQPSSQSTTISPFTGLSV
jgi:hypothetical protein